MDPTPLDAGPLVTGPWLVRLTRAAVLAASLLGIHRRSLPRKLSKFPSAR